MVVISLLTAFAIPGLRSNLFSDQLKTTTRKILGLISEASQEAVSRHAEYSLYFDLDNNTVSTVQEEQKTQTETQEESQYSQGKELDIPEAVQLVDVDSVHGGKQSQGRAVVRFSKKGYVDKTLIHLRTDDGDDMTIVLSPFLGVTKVYDSYLDLEDERISY